MYGLGLFCLGLAACSPGGSGNGATGAGPRFTLLSAAETGVSFRNTITENDSVNLFTDEYTYMGGGVGVGDFNRDGLPDLFFAGSQVSSRLYLNKGGLRFEDITDKAGTATHGWCTGVSVVDINNDGWPDIYVCVAGKAPGSQRRHLLFINQHNLTFKEEAAAYGLADTSWSTQALFFDFDHDGRLDMYLLNHKLTDERPNDLHEKSADTGSLAADKLYHNEGIPPGMDHPVFRDVSRQAGIREGGYGLGVVAGDFDGDGWPDIYVANDYLGNDVLWMNNHDGTFTNRIATATRHQSYSSMGCDAADYNNDGNIDIVTLDMQPESSQRKKRMYSFLNNQRHHLEKLAGYEPEYVRNMLQMNNGVRNLDGHQEPFFSEIGQQAGISETDWSWSALFADFDNDGRKDLHITNGMGRDPTNADFLEYRYAQAQQPGAGDENSRRQQLMDKLSLLGSVPLSNYLYRNTGDLEFTDVSAAAGIDKKSVSNGAVYVDLDNDGDLDLVVNNIDQEAFVLRNDSPPAHWLTLMLHGDPQNPEAIGARATAYSSQGQQVLELYPVRGFESSVDPRLHFGFGAGIPDSLYIRWPDGSAQMIRHPKPDTLLTVVKPAASDPLAATPRLGSADPVTTAASAQLFTDVTSSLGAGFRHRESYFFDYAFQPLLPQQYSQEGPFISIGDVNGDGLPDFFVGGAFKQSGKLFLQQPDGSFIGKDLVTGVKYEEDMQSYFFDADGDKDLDLLVVSGSSEFDLHSPYYRPRLYLNDGKGNFHLDSTAFPPDVLTDGKALAVADIDGDGDMDVFIGGRVALGYYPLPPRSYILRNDHGKFTDVTRTVCPALESPGLINAALFTDLDRDGRPDLIVAGDWMPVRIFHNEGGRLRETTDTGMQERSGWWRSLAVADVDGDGDPDIIAGNMGLNNPFHISMTQPAELIAKDLDGNGIIEPMFCYYMKNETGRYELSAGISRDEWALQMPAIKKLFPDNESFATSTMDKLFPAESMRDALVLQCRETRSGWFENRGSQGFVFHPFPDIAQVAPVCALVVDDIDGDGHPDIILAGNESQLQVHTGSEDASYGLLLKGNERGGFNAISPAAGGLILDGDVRDLKFIRVDGHDILLAAINDQPVKAYQLKLANHDQK
ncbi:hypothetical protein GCM10011511_50710 [Puia dinghuensis]|uniref:ASPIC/UnbV domain-containing protein n=1 Tax=Puia dinghuensis TaxID=1792502 RepID=A0A8J2UIH0_9BACT|nr:hypothetical protein GCM10011511_50710 [Puia dinghuensis]